MAGDADKSKALDNARAGGGKLQLPLRGSGGVVFTAANLVAMVLLFMGERLVWETDWVRLALSCTAGAALLAALVGRALRRGKVPAGARKVEGWLLLAQAAGVVALLVYFAQADFVMERLRPMFEQDRGADRYIGALSALWPVLWFSSLLPLLMMELSYAGMDLRRTMEPARVARSARSGLVLSMTLSILFLVNYIASQYDKKVDLSYFKTTRPSESSQKMVRNLSEPVRALLFYPGTNEVQELVQGYFQELSATSRQLKVEVVDYHLRPEQAKQYRVSDNGTVVLVRGKQHEQIQIGTKLERSKGKLKKLDGEFQRVFMKLSRGKKKAYFTTGHDERQRNRRDRVKGSSVEDLRKWLEKLNYEVADLGMAEGLASGVPGDATLVIMVGPRKPLMAAETASLVKYVKGGGRAMFFLDPEAGLEFADLLGPFGLKFTAQTLANSRLFYPVSRTPADRHFVITKHYSSHPSVSTLSTRSTMLATILPGVGFLSEVPATAGGKPQVQFTVHAAASTWNDANKNFVFDAKTEKRKAYEVAAVVTLAAPKGTKKDEARLLVVADSDLVSDRAFRNMGNGYLFIDALKWLGGEEKYIGEVTSEEDVRIRHSRKDDQVWFYLTIFAMPALVLGGGLTYIRRQRRRGSKA